MQFDISSKIFTDFESFESTLKKWRENGDSIVFTNGCFDIIHHGHVYSLQKSSDFGTKLIVGLNSDDSVRILKGKDRPIFDIEARSLIMASFVFIDAVIVFEEETPAKLIAQILPDVLVKGSEYALHEVVGFETVLQNGGKVERLDLIQGISTSEMIRRIKQLE
jgi:D-beta-D-heptose 7-phosphate kinase/D-beta-D-heptose 1-phosphate adenosyltransferase